MRPRTRPPRLRFVLGSPWSGLGVLAVLGLTLVAYARFLSAGFAATDSLPLIETSRFQSPADAAALFARPVMFGTRFALGEVVYRPFVSLTFGLEYALWSLNAVGYHATNIGLHLAGVLGMRFLLKRLGLRNWSSLAGAALFALHPVVVASVPVIARRDSLLPVTAFVAGAGVLLAADQAHGVRRAALLLAALLLVAVALLSKESAFAALLMLPVLVWTRRGSSNGLHVALARATLLLPFVFLAVLVFAIRLRVLGGLGGGSDADLRAIDMDRYSQTLGAFTRDLAWTFAWVAASTREIWPRLAGLSLAGLLLTLVCLPRRHAVLVAAGMLWVTGFALFCMILKIATIAWLLYFALVGMALVFAAGLEGALVRLRAPRADAGRLGALARGVCALLLAALVGYAASSLWASPLVRVYDQWQIAGDVTQRFTQALNACVAQDSQATRVNLRALPSTFEDGGFETPLLGVTLVEDYTVDAALRLAFPARDVAVHVSSWETLRAGADTLRFTCTRLPPDGVELTTSY